MKAQIFKSKTAIFYAKPKQNQIGTTVIEGKPLGFGKGGKSVKIKDIRFGVVEIMKDDYYNNDANHE